MGGRAVTGVLIIDYGVGNLRSVASAVSRCGAEPTFADTVEKLERPGPVILPGVGAFASCVEALKAHGLHDAVLREIARDRPILGICVGMQMLFEISQEFGEHAGFGAMAGEVVKLPELGADGVQHKIPHIGWSPLEPCGRAWTDTPLRDIEPGDAVYFVHSFAAQPNDPSVTLAQARYDGVPICAAVNRGTLTGVQFHPERSGPVGLRILRAFLKTGRS